MRPFDVVTDSGSDPRPPPTPDAPPGSMLAALRSQAAGLRKTKHLDVPIGGDLANVVVRYGFLALDDMDRYAELQPGTIKPTSLTIDMLVSACRTVLFRYEGELQDLGVGLDARLAEKIGLPLPTGMSVEELTSFEIVQKLFADNGMALVAHAERVVTWMQDPVAELDPGESSAATP